MLADFLVASVLILLLLSGWLGVQHWARRFAARHPELGPAREEGGGCLFCLCRDRRHCLKDFFRKPADSQPQGGKPYETH